MTPASVLNIESLGVEMPWAVPEFSAAEIDEAGIALAEANDPDLFDNALKIIDNFRASHHMPLNTFQTTLRAKAERFHGSVVAQRVKRLRAIRFKLQKRTKKPILLSQMQDIGGCRVVLANIDEVERLFRTYLNSDLKHKIVGQDDYIKNPKFSGYRGVHLVYSYYSDRKDTYNGLKIEIQFRTQLQHAWATAVEIVGFFRKELLKSGQGDHVWKHFFKLMAAEIAFEEKAAFGVPGIPGDRRKVREQLCRCAERLEAFTYLRTVGRGVQDVTEVNIPGAHYFLLELDTAASQTKVTGYRLDARARATWDYAQIERELLGSKERDAVLVSAKSMADLKRAYINYFLDMKRFIELAEAAANLG